MGTLVLKLFILLGNVRALICQNRTTFCDFNVQHIVRFKFAVSCLIFLLKNLMICDVINEFIDVKLNDPLRLIVVASTLSDVP